jgi:hypothetical protein
MLRSAWTFALDHKKENVKHCETIKNYIEIEHKINIINYINKINIIKGRGEKALNGS